MSDRVLAALRDIRDESATNDTRIRSFEFIHRRANDAIAYLNEKQPWTTAKVAEIAMGASPQAVQPATPQDQTVRPGTEEGAYQTCLQVSHACYTWGCQRLPKNRADAPAPIQQTAQPDGELEARLLMYANDIAAHGAGDEDACRECLAILRTVYRDGLAHAQPDTREPFHNLAGSSLVDGIAQQTAQPVADAAFEKWRRKEYKGFGMPSPHEAFCAGYRAAETPLYAAQPPREQWHACPNCGGRNVFLPKTPRDIVERLGVQQGSRVAASLRGDNLRQGAAEHWLKLIAADHWHEIISDLTAMYDASQAQPSAPSRNPSAVENEALRKFIERRARSEGREE